MLSVDAGTDGLPVIIAKLEGVAVYLDNWAIIELANGDAKLRERFVTALKACGSLLFSFTNSIELGEAEGEPANRVRTFLDEIGAHWIPIELNPWTVMDREVGSQTQPTPCISMLFIEAFVKDRMYEQSPEGSRVVDLSPESFFKLTSVMKWANAKKEGTRKGTDEIDQALIKRVADDYVRYGKDPWHLDNAIPNERYSKEMPTRFALLQLLRLLVGESKQFTLKKGDGQICATPRSAPHTAASRRSTSTGSVALKRYPRQTAWRAFTPGTSSTSSSTILIRRESGGTAARVRRLIGGSGRTRRRHDFD